MEGIRWSYSHTRELTLTANVLRGASVAALPYAARQLQLERLHFQGPVRDVHKKQSCDTSNSASRECLYTVDSMLTATHADAFLILHQGTVVAERYLHGANARTKRLGMSMTKTYTSMLIGILAQRGERTSSRQHAVATIMR